MATKKKNTVKDAAVATDETTTDTAVKAKRDPGRGRGNLERDILLTIQSVQAGETVVEKDDKLTPHRVSRLIAERDGLDKPPSAGAVSACFDRWGELKFANINVKPKYFKDFSATAKKADSLTDALDDLKLRKREKAKKDRAAAKAAEASAE
jgi:hypothetical protein